MKNKEKQCLDQISTKLQIKSKRKDKKMFNKL